MIPWERFRGSIRLTVPDGADVWLMQDAARGCGRIWRDRLERESLARTLYRDGCPADDWVEIASSTDGLGMTGPRSRGDEADYENRNLPPVREVREDERADLSVLSGGGSDSRTGFGRVDGCECAACRDDYWNVPRGTYLRGRAHKRNFPRVVGE